MKINRNRIVKLSVNNFCKNRYLLATAATILLGVGNIFSQNECLTPNEADHVIRTIKKPVKAKKNKKLKRELIAMRDKRANLNREAFSNSTSAEEVTKRSNSLNRKNLLRLCTVLKESGWITKRSVGEEGRRGSTILNKE